MDYTPGYEFEALKRLEIRAAKAVASVHGTLTAEEARELAHLRAATGETYDAVNGRWRPYTE